MQQLVPDTGNVLEEVRLGAKLGSAEVSPNHIAGISTTGGRDGGRDERKRGKVKRKDCI